MVPEIIPGTTFAFSLSSHMSILSWTLAGLVVGSVAGLVVGRYGVLEDVIVATVGAVIGGWLAIALFGASPVDFSITSLVAALVGGVGFIALSRGLTRDRSSI